MASRATSVALRGAFPVGPQRRDFSFDQGQRQRMVLRQLMRQRRGLRTFGFFSSIGKALKGVARTALGSLPVIGPAVSILDRIAIPDRAPPRVSPDQGRRTFAPSAPGAATAGAGCPPGFKIVRGRCVARGTQGAMQRLIPGGQTGMLTDEFGEAVIGGFGTPALEPAQVGTIMRRDGVVSPILRCPRGMVLGIDELCYTKGTVPRQFRKWKPAANPPISAADMKAVRTFASVQKKVKKLAGDSGLTCAKKGTKTRRRTKKSSHDDDE